MSRIEWTQWQACHCSPVHQKHPRTRSKQPISGLEERKGTIGSTCEGPVKALSTVSCSRLLPLLFRIISPGCSRGMVRAVKSQRGGLHGLQFPSISCFFLGVLIISSKSNHEVCHHETSQWTAMPRLAGWAVICYFTLQVPPFAWLVARASQTQAEGLVM